MSTVDGPAGGPTPEPPPLDPVEQRVLGCLLEKEVTTPDVYPLTLNSLVAACNQTTNRHPVMRLGEAEVSAALAALRARGLTRVVHSASNRATKYRQVADEVLELSPAERAVVGVLLLRGAQTLGELKARTERLHPFDDLAEVEATLDGLAGRDDPLVVRLARQPGQKDARYVHLLGGPPAVEPAGPAEPTPGVIVTDASLLERVESLEAEIAEHRRMLERLRPLLE